MPPDLPLVWVTPRQQPATVHSGLGTRRLNTLGITALRPEYNVRVGASSKPSLASAVAIDTAKIA